MKPASRSQRRSSRRRNRARNSVRRRHLTYQPLENRQLLAGDVTGLTGDMRIRYEFVDSGGAAVETLQTGSTYQLNTYVQDARSNAAGLFQTYLDIQYDSNLISTVGSVENSDTYGLSPLGDLSTPGLIDDVGGIDTDRIAPVDGGSELLLFSVDVRADAVGTLNLGTSLPSFNPRLPFFFNDPSTLTINRIDVLCDSIEIIGGGVTFTNQSNLQVSEGGAGATFQATLNRQPAAPVSFTIAPETAGLVSLSRTTLSFDANNWDTPQTVQVTAIDDSVDRGMTTISLLTGNLQSSDTTFNNVVVENISVSITDDDFAGVTLNPSFGFVTDEDGRSATTQVSLDSEPISDVTLSFTSTDTSEGIVSPAQLVFTPSNWNQARTLTITGVNDDDVDGQQSYAVIGSIDTSDPQYQNASVPTLSVTNSDNDIVDFLVQPNAGLITGESESVGGSDVFNVRLRSRPNSNVVLNVASTDTSEGVPSLNQLTFTPDNWDDTQIVRVDGIDDSTIDGAVAYQITVSPDPSSDTAYQSLAAKSVMVTNQDDDVEGLLISSPNRDFTTEAGGVALFTTRLQTEPVGTVTVNVASSDTTEGTVTPSQITFTSANWDQPQTITVTGVEDSTIDGPVTYNVNLTSLSTSDPGYNGLTQSVAFTNQDNDIPGIALVGAESLVTDENGGTDSFSIELSAQPTANVTINLASTNTNEVNSSPNVLTFTPDNWNVPQTVTVTGVNDNAIDGDQTANITFDFSNSADTSYQAFSQQPVSVTNQGDQARLLVQPVTGLITSEAAGNDHSDTFSVRLTRQPNENVVIDVLSSDIGEGTPDVSQLTFTPQNFDQPQTVTVTGTDDDTTDGDQAYEVSLTTTPQSDVDYRDLPSTTVMLTNVDDDVPALIIGGANPGNTTEGGGTSQIAVRLQTQPIGTVEVTATSSDPGEGSVTSVPLTFDSTNWDQNQTITVTGVDDSIVDGNVTYQITLTPSSSTDTDYDSGSLAQTLSLSNTNDDVPGLTVTGSEGLQTDESGLTDSFLVRLENQPLNNVSVQLASSDTGEVNVGPTTLDFTPSNWDQNQTVTLTGIDDGLVVDGNQSVSISFDLSQSVDTAYASLSVSPIIATNVDNDIPAVNVAAANPIVVSEDGTNTGTFAVSLATPPIAPVTIAATSQDTSEGSVSPGVLTFSASNFNQPQTITVTGVDDQLVDENVLFNVTLASTSTDPAYDGIPVSPVAVRNLNDDVGNVQVIAANDLTTSESGSTATFTVSLTRQPTENVTVPISVSDATELSIGNNNELLFTPENWNVPQTVTVTGLADTLVDPDIVSRILLGPTTSDDSDFNELDVAPVSITNTNVDTAAITVTGTDVIEGNAGDSRSLSYTLRLDGAVESGVSVNYAALAGTTGSPATAGIDFDAVNGTASFSGTDGETMQVNVTVMPDGIVESNESVGLRLSQLVTSNTSITLSDISLPTADGTAQILNDDTATVTISPSGNGASIFEGDAGGRTTIESNVVLSAPVQGGLSIEFATSDDTATIAGNDYVATNGTLTLDETGNPSQSVSVEIIGDDVPEADEAFNVSLTNLTAADAVIRDAITIVNSPLSLTIQNDDAPRLILRDITTNNNEGESSQPRLFRFEVELSDFVDDADGFSVPIRTVEGSAESTTDYTAIDTVLNFTGQAGETQVVEVMITGDEVVEDDETFSLRLGEITGLSNNAQVVVPTPEISTSIINDDTASIRLAASETSVTEGDSGTTTITFTATLEGQIESSIQVGYATSNSTATTEDADYAASNGLLTFTGQSGESQTFTVVINGDQQLETNEAFSVALDHLVGIPQAIENAVSLQDSPIEITIVADDRATLSISDAPAVIEGNGSTSNTVLQFEVMLSSAISSPLNVAFSTDDLSTNTTSDAGSDYVSTTGQITFAAGSTTPQTIRVPVNSDPLVEPTEALQVSLGDLSGLSSELLAFIDVERSAAIGQITNDDSATIVIQGPDQFSEPGGPGSSAQATYTATLSAPVQGGVSIAYATEDGTATSTDSMSDFSATSGILNFAENGNGQQSFTIDIQGDSRLEDNEQFNVRLGSLSNLQTGLAELISVSNQPITATITDDDSVSVSFVTVSSEVAESIGIHTVEVVLSTTGGAVLDQPLELDIVVESAGSATDNDFTLPTTRVTFPIGSSNGSSQIIQINLNDDEQTEPTESIVLSLHAVTPIGNINVSPSEHTVSITDDPRDAVISGYVFADTNSNAAKEDHELAIADVTIRLTGTDRFGESISRESITDVNGQYSFENLAAGTYTITQVQPSAFYDGVAIAPAASTANSSTITRANEIAMLEVTPSQRIEDAHFTERGYRADSIPTTAFHSRSSSLSRSSGTTQTSSSTVLDQIFGSWV